MTSIGKYRTLARVATLAVATLFGCTSGERMVSGEFVGGADVPTWEEFKAASALKLGDGKVTYVIEGDISVDEPFLRDYYQHRYLDDVQKSTVARSGGADVVWTAAEKTTITYCVSNAFGELKARAMADMKRATSQWMSAANVAFQYVDDSNCADGYAGVRINVLPSAGSNFASFPHTSGRHLEINYDDGVTPTAAGYSFLGLWTHETGHTLGLTHEHYNAPCNGPNDGDGFGFRLINSYDVNSSLHYSNTCGSTSTGQMTNTDKNGLLQLYGAPSSSVIAVLPTEWVAAAGMPIL